jgi:hypothetical protein
MLYLLRISTGKNKDGSPEKWKERKKKKYHGSLCWIQTYKISLKLENLRVVIEN